MKSIGYIGNIHPFINRLICLWRVLTVRNFILIEVREAEVNGKPGRAIKVHRRTDYNVESDYYTIKGALMTIDGEAQEFVKSNQ